MTGARPASRAEGLPRRERLRRPAEFQAVFRTGTRKEHPAFLALWRRGGGGRQVGFAASRQLRRAVRRNRARRRLREAYRRLRAAVPPGIQVVFVARPAALTQPFADLVRDMAGTVQGLAAAGREEGR